MSTRSKKDRVEDAVKKINLSYKKKLKAGHICEPTFLKKFAQNFVNI